ncbi:efflux RND transporter permease subunit [Halosquirtibacter laminarini]|uniref:Efflux RND transporter permease subunit n=1 Tax=Halosquirtibacter laminarini TaxID=3374600 RepID=A0AC61NHF9_9BACT|nr:efflux RND transporter permease subunit [Prolixibacteraceae bacterium]
MKHSFRINAIFVALAIVGLGLMMQLTIQLKPSYKGDKISVSFNWPNTTKRVIEQEVTSILESSFASIHGIEKIHSMSNNGRGKVDLQFKKETDMDAVRYEISSIVKNLYPKLPTGVSRPSIVSHKGGGHSDLLMTYVFNGKASNKALVAYLNRNIVPVIGAIDAVESVKVVGERPIQWLVRLKERRLQRLGLSETDVERTIYEYFEKRELGRFHLNEKEDHWQSFCFCGGADSQDTIHWNQIIVAQKEGRLIRLGEIAEVLEKEKEPKSYFRINGLNSLYLNIECVEGANQILLGDKIRDKMNRLHESAPSNIFFDLKYDASKRLKRERNDILMRSGLAILILLAFVYLISRDWRYLLLILFSLIINLAIAIIGYVGFKVQIHLYSLAGITVSLGIIIDNTIVTTDFLRRKKKYENNIFWAILASTLTTIGALSILFFLEEQQRMNLTDFAWVMIINLVVSLAIAYFFIPALMDKMPLTSLESRKKVGGLRKVTRMTYLYQQFIEGMMRHRKKVLFLWLLIFGIPLFLIPHRVGQRPNELKHGERQAWYVEAYNHSIGSEWVQEDFLPIFETLFGGVISHFNHYYETYSTRQTPREITIDMHAYMPDGTTLEQMNQFISQVENKLLEYDEITMFKSNVYPEYANLHIQFTKESQKGNFPKWLFGYLALFAEQTGSVDTQIFGIKDKSYSNVYRNVDASNCLTLLGYNYDQLQEFANTTKGLLEKEERVRNVIIHANRDRITKRRYDYIAYLDLHKLAKAKVSLSTIFQNLKANDYRPKEIPSVGVNGDIRSISIVPSQGKGIDIWQLQNLLIKSKDRGVRLKEVATVRKEMVFGGIEKENQQYVIQLHYDFIGPKILTKKMEKNIVEKVSIMLPIGYKIKQSSRDHYGWDSKDKKQFYLLLLVAIIIYVISAILLESLIQPLVVVLMIPLSYIGVFLTFILSHHPFGQGGYASLILLSGITVNSGLYIIYGYNNLNHKNRRSSLQNYLSSFNKKIIPILLTIGSTILGLIPFLIESNSSDFWFALAMGSIGGLLFSIVVVMVCLPLFLRVDDHRKKRIES